MDLNHRHKDLQSLALPTELCTRKNEGLGSGFRTKREMSRDTYSTPQPRLQENRHQVFRTAKHIKTPRVLRITIGNTGHLSYVATAITRHA